MNAAHRVPWRAFRVVPASVIGKTPYASRFGPLSSLSHSPQRPSVSFTCNSLSLTARRSFSVRVALLSREKARARKAAELQLAELQRKAWRHLFKYLAFVGVFGFLQITIFWDTDVDIYEQARYVYGALKRSGRVVGTLAVCINE